MLESIFARLREWDLITEGIGRLRQLDDRQLADIGVEREFIVQTAKTGVKVTHATLAETERQAAKVAARHQSLARPPSLDRRDEDCGSVPSMG